MNIKFIFTVVLYISTVSLVAQQSRDRLMRVPVDHDQGINGHLIYYPENYDEKANHPVIFFWHGKGSRGDGDAQLDKLYNSQMIRHIYNNEWPIVKEGMTTPTEDFIVIAPQTPNEFATPREIKVMIDYAFDHYKIDRDRVYLTGWSAGANSSWAAIKYYYSSIAAAMPMGSNADWILSTECDFGQVPIWSFHGSDDTITPTQRHINIIEGINACQPALDPPAQITIYEGFGHEGSEGTYNLNWMNSDMVSSDYTPFDMNIYEWLLQYRISDRDPSKAPIVNAGIDQEVMLSVNMVRLDGSASYDDTNIVSYNWSIVEQPENSSARLDRVNRARARVFDLSEGTYVFELRVSDGEHESTDKVKVVVKSSQQPVADAGPDLSFSLQEPSLAKLDASASSDSDGEITAYQWEMLQSPVNTLKSVFIDFNTSNGEETEGWNTVKSIQAGYTLSPLVDNAGHETDLSITLVTKWDANKLGGANTGIKDTIFPAAVRNGFMYTSASSETIQLSGLDPERLYDFKFLTSRQAGANDQRFTTFKVGGVSVSIDAVNNVDRYASLLSLVPDAEGNITIEVQNESNYAYLNAMIITTRAQTSSIREPDAAVTSVDGLTSGQYLFKLTVTDNDGMTDVDSVAWLVTDDAPVNLAPVADAGEDQEVAVGEEVVLDGSESYDEDGEVVDYSWLVTSTPTELRHRVLIDFTADATVTDSTWNVIADNKFEYQTEPLIDDSQSSTGWQIQLNSVWSGKRSSGGADGSEVDLPATHTQSMFFGERDQVLNMTGLNTEATYNFTFFSSRMVNGQSTRVTTFKINQFEDSVNAVNNTSELVEFKGVTPNPDGTLQIEIGLGDGSPYNYINAMVVEEILTGAPTIVSSSDAKTEVRGLIAAGEYEFVLTVTDDEGAESQDTVVVNVSKDSNESRTLLERSIINEEVSESVTFYPNTVRDYLNVLHRGHLDAYQVLSLSGKTIQTGKIESSELEVIDLSGLKKGVYVLYLRDDQGIIKKHKLLKQ